MSRTFGGTSPDMIESLVATATVETSPPPRSRRGRKPIYRPIVERVLAEPKGQVVVFGPFNGTLANTNVERVRSGAASFAKAHPEMLVPGERIAFSVSREEDYEKSQPVYWMRGWVEDGE